MSANNPSEPIITYRTITNEFIDEQGIKHMKIIKIETTMYSMQSSNETTKEVNDSSEGEEQTNDIDVNTHAKTDETFTTMITDIINAMPENRKFLGISEFVQSINEIISQTNSIKEGNDAKYNFKVSNIILNNDNVNKNYIKFIKDTFKSAISSKLFSMLFPLNNHPTLAKVRCRKSVDGLKDKWIIKFK